MNAKNLSLVGALFSTVALVLAIYHVATGRGTMTQFWVCQWIAQVIFNFANQLAEHRQFKAHLELIQLSGSMLRKVHEQEAELERLRDPWK